MGIAAPGRVGRNALETRASLVFMRVNQSMKITHRKKLEILGLGVVLLGTLAVRAELLYASGIQGEPVSGGFLLRDDEFYGVRFRVTTATDVTSVGGHLWAADGGGGLFAAIVRLDSGTAFPHGSPFAPGEVLASGAFTLQPGLSREYDFPLSVALGPGFYGLVFGDGLFGDPVSRDTAVSLSNVESPDSSDFQWTGPLLDFWTDNNWPPNNGTRLTVSGEGAIVAVPEPSIRDLLGLGAGFGGLWAVVFGSRRRVARTAGWR